MAMGVQAFWFLACTSPAEHSNPLDPQSPDYTAKGAIAGQVFGYYQPFRPLAGAMVKLQPPGVIVETDQNGVFRFADLTPQSYSLEASASGYAGELKSTDVLPRQTTSYEFHLDGLPVVQAASVTSALVSTRESADDRIFLEVIAEVHDPDGANDIKRARLEIPAFAFSDTLNLASGAARWQRLFAQEELAGVDLHNLTGTPLHIVAEDYPGQASTSAPFFLARVIAEAPQTISPANGDTITTDAPTFIWQTPAVQFDHTFRLEVFRLDAGFPAFVARIGSIAAGSTSFRYVGRLSVGSYFWTVRIIDDFGDSSRSKEATFQVQ